MHLQPTDSQFSLFYVLLKKPRSQGVGYEERLERLAEQFQEYKFAVHRQKLELQDQMKVREEAIRAEAAVRERVLQTELASVQAELALVRDELVVSQEWNQTMTQEFAALQANFTELRQMYMDEEMEWEDRLEMEQNDRRKDRMLAERLLKEAQEEAADKIRRARMDGTVVVEAVKSDFNNRLWQKETQLQKTSIELKRTVMDKNGLEERLEELEAEREDLGALTKQTAKVVKEAAKHTATNTLQKAKNFFRRNKLG
jgi:chromosome segregation ATPase